MWTPVGRLSDVGAKAKARADVGPRHIAAAGWAHLDVKPSNIVLNTRPRLIDFELARPAAEAARMTKPTGTKDRR